MNLSPPVRVLPSVSDMGERASMASVDIKPYEGLVHKTAQMWAWAVGMEEEDLRQEIRLKVAQGLIAYNASRSKLPLKNYIFGIVRNRITDLQKAQCRRANYGLTFTHIEAYADNSEYSADRLEFEYLTRTDHDQTYSQVDDVFELPATLTAQERCIVVLMGQEMRPSEIALRLGLASVEASRAIKVIKEKLADWRPTKVDVIPDDSSLPVVAVAA